MATHRDVLDFWFEETPRGNWFEAEPEFDAVLRARFEETWRAAKDGKLSQWEASPDGALALIIVLDQFPRNMFRGTAQAFATDAMARDVALRALDRGDDCGMNDDKKNFLYLPLMHSERLADQDFCVGLVRERMGEAHQAYRFALRHRNAIARFGRFPGRNAALQRESTAAESAFLLTHPSGF